MGKEITHFHREHILKELDFKWDSLLDVGCASGANLELIKKRFPDSRLMGVDINPKDILGCRVRYPEMNFVVGDARNLPFKDNEFDVIITDAVLMYIEPKDIRKVISEFKRVAKKKIVCCEWHTDLPTYQYEEKWVRNYEKLGAKIIKLPPKWKDPERWDKFGRIIVWRK